MFIHIFSQYSTPFFSPSLMSLCLAFFLTPTASKAFVPRSETISFGCIAAKDKHVRVSVERMYYTEIRRHLRDIHHLASFKYVDVIVAHARLPFVRG